MATVAADAIISKPDGQLKCQDCGDSWCMHLQEFLTQGADAAGLWNYLGMLDDETVVPVQVPYVPSLGQWANIHLRQPHFGNWKVFIGTADQSVMMFLGYLSPGEGRRVLREIIHDWFRPKAEDADLECQSSAHGWKAQQAWERATRKKFTTSFLAEKWSVYWTQKCITCSLQVQVADDSDLIPDVAAPRRRSWS